MGVIEAFRVIGEVFKTKEVIGYTPYRWLRKLFSYETEMDYFTVMKLLRSMQLSCLAFLCNFR
ncbi:MAG: hypothetical protein FD174_90 [Geobacteraceae bacterium]|nr:MAG: hypothetical protein FD174_90 [Geobacteraceae bacterium]